MINISTFKTDAFLLTAAIIWGTTFVAQRVGMEYLGPFTYTGIRFALGSLALLPLLVLSRDERVATDNIVSPPGRKKIVFGIALAGSILFAGISLQQVGLVYTTAGKSGFITSLYVVIVPFLGLFFHQRTTMGTWIGVMLAAAGLYLLSVTEQFSIALGDLLNLIGAFFWAGHVLVIAWLSPVIRAVKLAFLQFAVCALLSLIVAFLIETTTWQAIADAALPIFYGGIVSVGVGFTLQVVAQREAHPAHAAILLSMEALFAAVGGWIILGETLSFRGMVGCLLMLTGMLVSQLWEVMKGGNRTENRTQKQDPVERDN